MSDIKMNDEFENFIEIDNDIIQIKKVSNVDEGYKIFVGNIPYNCTQDEFDVCFIDVRGFIKAEIIKMYKTQMSRGFGFVTVKTLNDVELLKKRDDIIFKGRTLRFTSYQDGTYKPTSDNFTNYVLVDGIPEGKNREWLKEKFFKYEPIGRCFISMNQDTGDMKTYGVIEVLDDNKYKYIISKKWHNIEGKFIETSRYKYENTKNNGSKHEYKPKLKVVHTGNKNQYKR
jgi:RNA recognition motif-containing protein